MVGGKREYLEVASEIVDILARETLSKGHMGTDENLISILMHRFPTLVRARSAYVGRHWVERGIEREFHTQHITTCSTRQLFLPRDVCFSISHACLMVFLVLYSA